jgi:methionyl-tRNA synthetase
MDVQAIHDYLAAIWKVIGDANGYFARCAPWALKKTDPARMATVLYVTAEVVRRCAIMAQPVAPDAMGKLLDQLAVPTQARTFAHAGEAHRLTPGTALPAPEGVFPRHQTDPKEV